MAKSQHILFAKNLICVCVEGCADSDYQGIFYHQYSDDPIEFYGIKDLLTKMEGLYDEWDFPQRGLAQRYFGRDSRSEVTYKPKKHDDKLLIDALQEQNGIRNVQNKKGKIGTFVIQVVYRQNATWQGHVIHQEKNEKKDFESAMELIRFIDGTLSQVLDLEDGKYWIN